MIHECKLLCILLNQDSNYKNMKEKWLPFAFDMRIVGAIKVSSDDVESVSYGMTTVFGFKGETYVIDTLYPVFLRKFKEFHGAGSADILADDSDEPNL